MAKRTACTRRADRHGQPTPTVEQSAACDIGSHARCRGEVISLLVPVGTPCGCICHRAQLPPTWAATTTERPPCDLDGGEAA